MLAIPPEHLFQQKSLLDEKVYLEHILEVSYDGKDFTSLSGRNYSIEGEKKLVLAENNKFQALIIQKDIAYAPDNAGTYKRILVSNSLDPRFYCED